MSKARGPYRVDPLGYKKANEALDKKAENARELGLDYEPVCNKDPQGCWNVRCQLGKKCKNTPAQQEPLIWGVDWGRAGDVPCVSIIKRLAGGGIEVVAVEYGPTPPSWIEVQQVKWEGDKLLAKLKEKNT